MSRLKNIVKNIPVLSSAARRLYGLLKAPPRIEALMARLDEAERRLRSGADQELKGRVAALARDLEMLHQALKDKAGISPENTVKELAGGELSLDTHFYLAFENRFRGPQEGVTKMQSQYLPDIEKAAQQSKGEYLLDVGCGRGEFLKLVEGYGIRAKGVDITQAMVEECRRKGLSAEHGDTLKYLESVRSDSLIGVTAFQVVEHVTHDYLVEFIKAAFSKTAPGGVIILETVNSDSLNSLRNFYLDLTHRNPIPAGTLQFLVEYAGFRDVRVHYSSPVPPESRLSGNDDNTRKLNDLLFGPQDYAIIGWK